MKKNSAANAVKDASTAIGAGILAGIAGTIAITISQTIEMKITGRKPSTGPADAVEKTLDIKPKPGTKKKLANEVHWTYGTMWGLVRGMLGLSGLNQWVASGIHFGAITGTAMAMAPLEGSEPVTKWTKKQIAIEVLHHAVYAMAAGCVFDAIYHKNK